MNILFTICARAGSKGVRGKNTRYLCGKPLAYYTAAAFEEYLTSYGQAVQASLAVNTDSNLLLEQLNHTGLEYLHVKRRPDLAGDTAAKKDVIKDTLEEAEDTEGKRYEIVVDLDLTSPLRTAADIDGTIQTLLRDKNADIAYTVTDARRSPYFNMVVQDENGYYTTVIPSDFVARQQAPGCYDMNASIYAYRREYLLSSRINNRRALAWIMKDTGILDIDCEHDLELMEIIAGHLFSHHEAYGALKKRTDSYKIV